MGKILSFGGGLQTTALAIMVAKGELDIDEAVFADTGCEKPETYYYIDAYIKPILKNKLTILPPINGGLIGYCNKYRIIPSVVHRWCTRIFKIERIDKYVGNAQQLIGFSTDEVSRVDAIRGNKTFPLIEMGISAKDCHYIISDYGYPTPLKSSCFFCPYQRWTEWNWLKTNHPELLKQAVSLEQQLYDRRPQDKEKTGLFGGKPLWKFAEGIQYEFGFVEEYSCWSGYCSH